MKNFTYKSKYGTYKNCYFYGGTYPNGNIALEICNSELGSITRVTTNPGIKVADDCLAIKDYSENVGMVSWMQTNGFIKEGPPIRIIHSGFVEIPVYQMTDLMKCHLLGVVEEDE